MGWQQADGGNGLAGALAIRIEGADGIDFIIEEVDAIWLFRAHREEIQQGAAGGKLAVFENLLDRVVTSLFQTATQTMQIEAIPRF